MGGSDKKPEKERLELVECRKCHANIHKESLDRQLTVEHGPRFFYWCLRCSHKNNRRDKLRGHCKDFHPDRISEEDHIKGETYEEREKRRSTSDRSASRGDGESNKCCLRKETRDGKTCKQGKDLKGKCSLDSDGRRKDKKSRSDDSAPPCTVSRPEAQD